MSLVIKYGGIAQSVEHTAVNRGVVGSSPTVTAIVLLRYFYFHKLNIDAYSNFKRIINY